MRLTLDGQKKNPRTRSYIWTAVIIQEGHEEFCETWRNKACVQLEDADGNKSFVPIVPSSDPDLTVYEDVDQVLLNENADGWTANKKHDEVQLPRSSVNDACETYSQENDENVLSQPANVIAPEEISRSFSEIQNNSLEPNCSAIAFSQVILFINTDETE